MSVIYDRKNGLIRLENDLISYLIYVNKDGISYHLYFGKKIGEFSIEEFIKAPDANYQYNRDGKFVNPEHYYQNKTLVEYSTYLRADDRVPSIEARIEGDSILDFRIKEVKIGGRNSYSDDIPHVREFSDKDNFLELILKDEVKDLYLHLYYVLLSDSNVLIRSAKLENRSDMPIHLNKIMSLTLDLPYENQKLIHFPGGWANERNYTEEELSFGNKQIYTHEGRSSHYENPFVILKDKYANEDCGTCLGINLVYSGNHLEEFNVSSYGQLRINAGIDSYDFDYEVKPGESFTTPEAVVSYSTQGLNGLSAINHEFVRRHIISKEGISKQNILVFNSWEGAFMDFDTKKILDYAKEAKKIGAEIFVLDDGWFSTRNDDQHGLGDWEINDKKIDLKKVETEIHKMGMKFGIWIEPEAVNIDTRLYKEHSDFVLGATKKNENYYSRNQLNVDFSNFEAVDYVLDSIVKSLNGIDIDYIKYDMNRILGDIVSSVTPQGEVYHRFVLGVYRFMAGLLKAFPHILFENCASGGGRFDLGMLFFSPQIWTSDETNPMRRLFIQYGTSYGYPLSCMSSHVSMARGSYLDKANVAFFGTYGYEMDPRILTVDDKKFLNDFSQIYKKYHKEVIDEGTFHRILSPFNTKFASFISVSQDQTKAIFLFHSFYKCVNNCFFIKLKGLNPNYIYRIDNQEYSGSFLLNVGLNMSYFMEADQEKFLIIERVK